MSKIFFIKDIKKSDKSCKEFSGEKKYIATGDILDNKIVSYETVTFKSKPSRANVVCVPGDVLFAKMQGTIKVIKISEESANYIFSTGFYSFRDERIMPDYLKYYFLSPHFNVIKDKNCRGATMKAINDEGMSHISIPLYSTEKQKEIIKTLDNIQKFISNTKNEIVLLNELINARFYEMFGDIETNEKKWRKGNITEVIDGRVSNGFFAKRDDYCDNGNVQVLGVVNVVNRMYSGIEDLPRTSGTKSDIEKYGLRYGDMLFCRSSLVAEGIGKASIVPKNVSDDTLFECHVIRLPLDLNKCVPEFMQVLSTTDSFRKQIISQSKTATMTTISQDGILKTTIIIPPFKLQKTFALFVEKINKMILNAQSRINYLNEILNKKMEEYFGGDI